MAALGAAAVALHRLAGKGSTVSEMAETVAMGASVSEEMMVVLEDEA